jgi:hypothetical protein
MVSYHCSEILSRWAEEGLTITSTKLFWEKWCSSRSKCSVTNPQASDHLTTWLLRSLSKRKTLSILNLMIVCLSGKYPLNIWPGRRMRRAKNVWYASWSTREASPWEPCLACTTSTLIALISGYSPAEEPAQSANSILSATTIRVYRRWRSKEVPTFEEERSRRW